MEGLVIRYFMGGYFLCNGKSPKGFDEEGEIYVGNVVKWFETWDEANAMRNMINEAYGRSEWNWKRDTAMGGN